MSGGFFRGTSADQDTRFSNKQAKLLKSQKFAPELEHLVDVTKVKMDVIRPWIANRVTELLGFEDEVLINFIYGLLDGKEVNGKEIQIQITGFMEKNTGKFMKELWGLLLSAQKNASGVPQQFLDVKEEEIRKKKAETDRIAHEIQKKEDFQQDKLKKMDNEVDVSEAADDASYPVSKHFPRRASSAHPTEDKESDERNGLRGNDRFSKSPSADRSLSSERRTTRSISKSLSNSRSYSDDRHKSRSVSRSPHLHGHSISPEMHYRSPRKRSTSPHKYSPRRPRSPLRRRSPLSRRRTSSHSWRRSPSPRSRRSLSPMRRRSPSPKRHISVSPTRRRSPSPMRRRSPPMRRRSRSPLRLRRSPTPRRRSPSLLRRRSPSPRRRRSPSPRRRRSPPRQHRSPSPRRHRSPPRQRRSPSPRRRRSPSPRRGRSPSPHQRRSPSPRRRRSPSPMRSSPPRSAKHWRRSPLRSYRQRNRSQSPYKSRSPAYQSRRSFSRDRDIHSNGAGSKRSRDDYIFQRAHRKRSPTHHAPDREVFERSSQQRQGSDTVSRLPPISLRSPQRDPKDRSDTRKKIPVLSPSQEKSPSQSESSPRIGKTSLSEDRTPSPSGGPMRQTLGRIACADSVSPMKQTRDWIAHHDSPKAKREGETSHARRDRDKRTDSPRKRTRQSPTVGGQRNIPMKDFHHEECSPDGFAEHLSGEARGHLDNIELRNKDWDRKSEKTSTRTGSPGSPQRSSHMLQEIEYGPGRIEGERFSLDCVPDEKRSRSCNVGDSGRGGKTESVQKSMKNIDHNNRGDSFHSDSEENKKRSEHVEKKKHKRSGRRKVASDEDASYDSGVDERKEAKRRRKEEKRLRKEEKRQRREERHRKREERRAFKMKAKSMDTVNLPSDIEKNRTDADNSDGDVGARRGFHVADVEETESEQKKLEIELRKKALESLRAKKGINP